MEFLIPSFNSLQSESQRRCGSAESVNYHNVFWRNGTERKHKDQGDFLDVWLPG